MTNESNNKKKFKSKEKPKPTTPSLRIGLVNKVYTAEDILSFSYNAELINETFKQES